MISGAQGLYDMRRQYSVPLRVLMAVVALVLLVACANLASLLLARATARRHELRIRSAVGASRLRLLRQLFTEALLLSAIGGLCGLWIAGICTELLVQTMSRGQSPIVLDLTLHGTTIAFAIGVTVVTAILFGIGPALSATAPPDAQGRVAVWSPRRWTRVLIVSQVALCLTVLIGAGLMLGTVRNLARVDAGFRRDRVLLLTIRPGPSYPDRAHVAIRRLATSILGAARRGIRRPRYGYAALRHLDDRERFDSRRPAKAEVNVNLVGPRFFQTFGIPLLSGRELLRKTTPAARRSASLRKAWPPPSRPAEPLGLRIDVGGTLLTVGGVVKGYALPKPARRSSSHGLPPPLQTTDTWVELNFAVRTAGDPHPSPAFSAANFATRPATCRSTR